MMSLKALNVSCIYGMKLEYVEYDDIIMNGTLVHRCLLFNEVTALFSSAFGDASSCSDTWLNWKSSY